jgi:hypothetical protein
LLLLLLLLLLHYLQMHLAAAMQLQPHASVQQAAQGAD